MSTLESVHDETPEGVLRRFVDEQGASRTAETLDRYHETIDRLLEYLETVDARQALDPESAELLDQARSRSDGQTFLSVLGFDALVRVLPGFLDDPWLPPRGLRRAGHRSLVERLLVFLRREGLIDIDAQRREYRAVKDAVLDARTRDYAGSYGNGDPWADASRMDDWRSEPDIQVVVSLPAELVNHLTARIRFGEHSDLSSLVAAAIQRDRWGPPSSASMQAWGR